MRTKRNGDSFLSAQGDEVLGGDELSGDELRFFVLQASYLAGFGLLFCLFPLTAPLFVLLSEPLFTIFTVFEQRSRVAPQLLVDSNEHDWQVPSLLHGLLDRLVKVLHIGRADVGQILASKQAATVRPFLKIYTLDVQHDGDQVVVLPVRIFFEKIGVDVVTRLFEFCMVGDDLVQRAVAES